MKILKAAQIRAVDAATIHKEPIASINLMERAAQVCVKSIGKLIKPTEKIIVICGKGNNGGDGLAITRLLLEKNFDCVACTINYKSSFSNDAQHNLNRLKENYAAVLTEINNVAELRELCSSRTFIVDALFGTGLNKAADGLLANVIDCINSLSKTVVSVDVPSGLFIDETSLGLKHIVKSNVTLSFQLPKLAFLMPENETYVNQFKILDIGLSREVIATTPTNNYYITTALVSSLLKRRNKFSHKGNYGHALLIAGSKGKSGAAIISAKAAMRSGTGLLTVQSVKNTLEALLVQLPEAMGVEDNNNDFISGIDKPEKYNAIGFGPGVGLHEDTQRVFKKLLSYSDEKLVIDADGLNILSENKTWLSFLPANCILTPHPKEFERLFGKYENDFERIEALRHSSVKLGCIIILKGAHSAVAMPDGTVFFNSSGNAGLAKAGSGDGLTGIILGLLSRGYTSPQAAIIGTFIHGYAADLCIQKGSMESLLISDVIKMLPRAFKKLEGATGREEQEF